MAAQSDQSNTYTDFRGHWVADRLEELSEEIDELLREAEIADEVPFGAGSATQDVLSSLDTAIRRWRR